jgi:hypothetical protein
VWVNLEAARYFGSNAIVDAEALLFLIERMTADRLALTGKNKAQGSDHDKFAAHLYRSPLAAFDNCFNREGTFDETDSARLTGLGLKNIDAKVAFSPHRASNALLDSIGRYRTATSAVFYSLVAHLRPLSLPCHADGREGG